MTLQRKTDPLTWWARRLGLPPLKTTPISGGTRTERPGIHQTAEQEQPWVIYTYGRIHDRWWPPWRSSRVLGRAAVGMTCAICGAERTAVGKLPRFGPVNPEGKKHPERIRFLLAHLHKDRPHPMAWAKPLLNMNVHPGGLDLDMLAMRLEADLREQS